MATKTNVQPKHLETELCSTELLKPAATPRPRHPVLTPLLIPWMVQWSKASSAEAPHTEAPALLRRTGVVPLAQ